MVENTKRQHTIAVENEEDRGYCVVEYIDGEFSQYIAEFCTSDEADDIAAVSVRGLVRDGRHAIRGSVTDRTAPRAG